MRIVHAHAVLWCAGLCWGPQAWALRHGSGDRCKLLTLGPMTPLQMLRLLGQLRPAAAHAGALLLRHACLAPPQSLHGGGGSGGGGTSDPLARGELLVSILIAIGKCAAGDVLHCSALALPANLIADRRDVRILVFWPASVASALQHNGTAQQLQRPRRHRDSAAVRRAQA